jgi:hypothetical protein
MTLDLDPDTGEPRQPFRIMEQFILQDIEPLRGKDGRLEFWSGRVESRITTDGRPGEGGASYDYRSNK